MRIGATRGVALGVAWIVLVAGCQTAPPPQRPMAPPESAPSSPEEARQLYVQLRLEATWDGFRQAGNEFTREDVAPLFERASSKAGSRFELARKQARTGRRLKITGGALLAGGLGGVVFAGMLGAVAALGAMGGNTEEDDSSDAASFIDGVHRVSGLIFLTGGGLMIGSIIPSSKARASFRGAAQDYNADLRRRLDLVGPAQ